MQTAPVRRLLVLATLAAAAVGTAGPANAAKQRLSLPNPLEVGQGLALALPQTTTTVDNEPARTFALWGGPYVTPTGETVNVRVSDTYPQDPAFAQQWANFLSTLYHHLRIPGDTEVVDRSGRPLRLLERDEPIRELIGQS